jgi:hypothetical protein
VSARRWFQGALLLAALGMTAASRSSSRDPQIVARVGGNLAGRVGDTLDVPITVDLTGAPGVRLGGYRLTVRWNPNVFYFQDGSNGTFAPPFMNADSLGYGVLRMTAIQPSGADGMVTLGVGHFVVQSDTGASDITIAFDEMSGVAPTFDDLLPILTVVNGTFCHASGKWGDTDGDGQANSRDALIALSRVVGIALDTVRIDTLWTDTAGVHTDTVATLRPGLADVDADGQVTSRDALIIMSYAVGLPVTGFRIGLADAGACGGSGLGLVLAVAPDTLELQTGQSASAVVSARDAAGHPISLSGATWTSSNTAVAGVESPGFYIDARDPGVAVLTVGLGASYRASMVVRVLAHRTQWFVDVARSQAALQTGSQAFPFAYIQEAFDAGRDGDTINVAPGTYEESVSSDISVYLRGDPVHPPVLDPRGAFNYYAWGAGLFAGSRVAPMRVENLRVLHGQVEVYAHDFTARNLDIEASDSAFPALYFSSALAVPPGAPAGGPLLDSGLPMDTGNVELDSVTVHGAWGTWDGAIRIDVADTVIIRNSVVTRDSTPFEIPFPACGGDGPAGIYVNDATRTEISNTTVLNAPCGGIGVRQTSGTVWVSGNTVDRAGGFGIVSAAPVIAFDHNTVTRIISGSSEAQAAGMIVLNDGEIRVQSVTSVGDVIRSSGDRGFAVWGAVSAEIDSLTVDTTGLDGTNTSAGVEFWGGHLTLSNSRISNVLAYGTGVLAWTDTTASVLESRHNVIWNTQGQGLYTTEYTPGYGCAPPVFGAAPVARGAMGGCGGNGPDTLISVGDSILFAGGSGIQAESARRLFVDSAVVDSAGGNGIDASSVGSVQVLHSVIRTPLNNGINLYSSDSLLVEHSAISGAFYGVNAQWLGAFAKVFGSSIDSSADDGVYIYTVGPVVPVLVDSSRILGNGNAGIDASCSSYPCTDSLLVTRSTIAANLIGLVTEGYQVTARNNNIQGNGGGAANWVLAFAVIDADTNFWGDTLGPVCSVPGGATGCDPTSVGRTGDMILTAGISIAGWLTAPATGVMPAPRFIRPAARRLAPVAVTARPPRPAAAASTSRRPFAMRAAQPQQRPRAPMMSWRHGQPPRPARAHHPS